MVDRDAPYSGLASIMAMNGRYGDTELVHMSKPEIRGLASIGELTINPETGLPEAFSLSSLLPMALNVGLGIATGGMSTMGQMALMGAVNFGLGKATGKSTKDALFDGAFAAAGTGLSRVAGIGGSGSSAVKGGGKGGGTEAASAGAAGAAGAGSVASSTAAADAGVQTAVKQSANMAGLEMGANAPELIPSVSDGVSAAYPAPTVPSSGIMDWISDNPGKTALGVGGLGMLLSGDEEYPEEEPQEIEKLPQYTLKGADPIDRTYTEEGLVDLYTRGAAGDLDRKSRFNYFTRPEYERLPSELNTGGLVGLDDNQGTSQSSGVANFLQSKQGNNNVITQQGVMDNMFSLGASAGKADEEKGIQSLVSPVDVVAPSENTGRLRLELLDGGKHRYVRDAPLVVEEPVGIIPVPDTNEEPSDNADDGTDGFSGQNADPGGMTMSSFSQSAMSAATDSTSSPNDSTNDPNDDAAAAQEAEADGMGDDPNMATGGLISMLKKAEGGIVSLAEGKRPRPKSKPNSKLINKLTKYLMDKEDFRSETYIPTKDDKPTIGFGHTGKYAKKGAKITKKKAKEILSEDIKIRMPELENKIEDFNSLPLKLQTTLAGEYFRGSVGQSPKTIDYINQGKYGEAAKEFLINEEYMNAEDNNRAGIMPRMEAVSNELNELQNYLDKKDSISKIIPFSEGGTLEQYYQGQVIGKGDGMSDEILFDVEGRNPDMALLSRDEYVIPADVVSMIGNGSSNAGAEELDGFLKNVRQQSFGTRKQQREMTNPQKGLSALV